MPYSVTLGSTIIFTATFFSSAGETVIPSSASITISYPPVGNILTTASVTIDMSQSGSFFTATWGSGVAGRGAATFSVIGDGQIVPLFGQMRFTS